MGKSKPKPKVAFFDFTSCEGCQLAILNLESELLDLLEIVDIVEFREAMSEKSDRYDISLIEGSYSRESDLDRLNDIRARSKSVIALGACAHIGGLNSLRNNQTRDEVQRIVYPNDPTRYETNERALPIAAAIEVDGFIPGCPVDVKEFAKVLSALALGKSPGLPTYPLCVECKMNENQCVYERGSHCLGPVIRAGCDAVCIASGGVCIGCRGLVPDPNINSQKEIMARYGLSVEQTIESMNLFLTEDINEDRGWWRR